MSASVSKLPSTTTPRGPANLLPPVVIVHGIFRDERLMSRLRRAFLLAGRRVFTPNLKPNDGSVGMDELARQFGEFLEDHLAPGETCDVIGHSMGGIVARTYLQRHGGRTRVRRLVTLASPHHGTWTAWLRRGRGVRELRPGSAFLRELTRDTDSLDGILVASYWTPFDLIIVPPRSSQLPIGRNVRVNLPHHQALVTYPRMARELVELLGR